MGRLSKIWPHISSSPSRAPHSKHQTEFHPEKNTYLQYLRYFPPFLYEFPHLWCFLPLSDAGPKAVMGSWTFLPLPLLATAKKKWKLNFKLKRAKEKVKIKKENQKTNLRPSSQMMLGSGPSAFVPHFSPGQSWISSSYLLEWNLGERTTFICVICLRRQRRPRKVHRSEEEWWLWSSLSFDFDPRPSVEGITLALTLSWCVVSSGKQVSPAVVLPPDVHCCKNILMESFQEILWTFRDALAHTVTVWPCLNDAWTHVRNDKKKKSIHRKHLLLHLGNISFVFLKVLRGAEKTPRGVVMKQLSGSAWEKIIGPTPRIGPFCQIPTPFDSIASSDIISSLAYCYCPCDWSACVLLIYLSILTIHFSSVSFDFMTFAFRDPLSEGVHA